VKVSGFNVDVMGVALWCLVGVDYVGYLTDHGHQNITASKTTL
jgi:hypothetical protein